MEKNKMLIDATHPEETRVVVLRGGRVEEFDFESASRKPLRGNIYLAKVTRVEPSLQAAFIEYGGNRHGFLAFSEIHPDYYQIPFADRQALIDEEVEEEARAEREADARAERRERGEPARARKRRGAAVVASAVVAETAMRRAAPVRATVPRPAMTMRSTLQTDAHDNGHDTQITHDHSHDYADLGDEPETITPIGEGDEGRFDERAESRRSRSARHGARP